MPPFNSQSASHSLGLQLQLNVHLAHFVAQSKFRKISKHCWQSKEKKIIRKRGNLALEQNVGFPEAKQ